MSLERLLGSLIKGALTDEVFGKRSKRKKRRKSSLFGLSKGQVGMGVLAGAFAAFEHYSKSQSSSNTPTQNAAPTGSNTQQSSPTATPPPLPPLPTTKPLPLLPPLPTPLPPLPDESANKDVNETAKLIIQAMVSAAAADGEIDSQEQAAILKKVEDGGLTEDERQFILYEMNNPLPLEQIAAQVQNPSVAQQVYIASLLAIVVDTDAEREHMARLASLLHLDEATVSLLRQETGD